ncbi:MAG: DUF551 domain-containing protein [Enterobacter hormaechei subsp. steigerwaltii]|nr:DUF551 domain-containing protein [Enterobacter hormaechei subsp. steigerwaltii]
MAELTKEWLIKAITELEEERDATPGAVNEDAAMALAAMKLALASLEEEGKLSSFIATQESLGGEFEGVLTENIESIYVTSNPAVKITSRDLDEGFDKWYTGDACGTKSIAPEWFSEALKPVFLETWRACRAAMLQGAEPVTTAYKLPDAWVACSERMPEADGNYWGWWSESKRQGPAWFIKSELQAQFQSSEITHWMPLPAAPQQGDSF